MGVEKPGAPIHLFQAPPTTPAPLSLGGQAAGQQVTGRALASAQNTWELVCAARLRKSALAQPCSSGEGEGVAGGAGLGQSRALEAQRAQKAPTSTKSG